MAFSIFVLYAVRVLHLSSIQVGLVFACGSVGAVVGALVAGRVQRRFQVGPTIIAGSVLFCLGGLAYPLAPKSFPLPVLIVGFFASSLGSVVYNITQVSFRQAITPERLQGRMNAAMRWIVWGTIPIGTILGGVIGSAVELPLRALGRRDRQPAAVLDRRALARSLDRRAARAGGAVGEPDETALPPHLD